MSVSVIIPAYNACGFIRRAIDSVLDQSVAADEIIVIDDASTDDTRTLVASLAQTHPQIRLIALPANGGPSAARNAGIAAASGDWIAILDADDAWKPGRLERLLEVAADHACDLVADNVVLYDQFEKVEVRLGLPPAACDKFITIVDLFESEKTGISSFSYVLIKPMISRRFLEKHGLCYNERLKYSEDFVFLSELLFHKARAFVTGDAHYVYTTRIGELSGVLNPHSQTVPRFDLVVQAGDELRAKYRSQLTPRLEALMSRRRTEMGLIHHANVAREYRRSGRLVRYVLYLLMRPSLVFFLARRAPGHLQRWLRRRRTFRPSEAPTP
ncbi:MAG: glycosyl transferase family 2 [Caulobacteraceae bacterium]|nr:glycosyl transferase family 2 [Caulobacteraceae bacterium]